MAVDISSVLLYSALLAYVPPLIYAVIVRYAEKYKREPWGAIFSAFLWGATIAFLLLTLVRGYISIFLDDYYPELINEPHKARLIQDMILIPMMMLVLPLGLITVRHEMEEAEDGLIYGAIVGVGFAATENFIFGFFSLATFGMDYFINLVIVRDLSVMLLYAAAASFVGYGVTRATATVHRKGGLMAMPLFYLAGCGLLWGYVFILDGGPRIYFDVEGMDLTTSYRLAFIISAVVGMLSAVIMYVTIYRVDRIDELWDEDEEEAVAPAPRRTHQRAAAHHRPAAHHGQAAHHPPAAAAVHHPAQQQRAAHRQAHPQQHHRQPAQHHHQQQAHAAAHRRPPARRAPAQATPASRASPGHQGRRTITRAPPAAAAPAQAAPARKAPPAAKGRKKMKPVEEPEDDEDEDWMDDDYGEEEAQEHEKKKGKKKAAADDDDEDIFDFDLDDMADDEEW